MPERTLQERTAFSLPPHGIKRLIGQDWGVRHRSKALCTAATGAFLDLLEVSGPTFEGYARRHGWKLLIVTEDTAEGDRPHGARFRSY